VYRSSMVFVLDVEDFSGCIIEQQHKSPYVTAFWSQPVSSYGCISRELVPTTDEQVDVILFNVSSSTTTHGAELTTTSHHRQHIHITLKQSVNYGMLY